MRKSKKGKEPTEAERKEAWIMYNQALMGVLQSFQDGLIRLENRLYQLEKKRKKRN